MWWPALGGVAIGIGGLIFPPALGVGYDVIGELIGGNITWHLVLGFFSSRRPCGRSRSALAHQAAS